MQTMEESHRAARGRLVESELADHLLGLIDEFHQEIGGDRQRPRKFPQFWNRPHLYSVSDKEDPGLKCSIPQLWGYH